MGILDGKITNLDIDTNTIFLIRIGAVVVLKNIDGGWCSLKSEKSFMCALAQIRLE